MLGVFLGAWLGARFGYKENVRLKNEELLKTKETYLIFLRDELIQNGSHLSHRFKEAYHSSEEIEAEFKFLELVADSIRKDFFDACVKGNILPVLDNEVQSSLMGTYSALNQLNYFVKEQSLKFKSYESRSINLNRIIEDQIQPIKILFEDCAYVVNVCIKLLDQKEKVSEKLTGSR